MYNDPLLPPLIVSDTPVFTGVLDAAGQPIYRQKNPIGFGRDKEWSKEIISRQPKS